MMSDSKEADRQSHNKDLLHVQVFFCTLADVSIDL